MGGGPPGFRPDSSCPAVLWILLRLSRFRLRGSYPLWLNFPFDSTTKSALVRSPQPRSPKGPVWPLSRSLAATQEIVFTFSSSAYLDVSVQRVPSVTLWIYVTVRGLLPRGFPHSEICGSIAICASPQLIAACHVLLRLLMPRHSPCALVRLTIMCLSVLALRLCIYPFQSLY